MSTELLDRLRADARKPLDDRRRYDAAFDVLDSDDPLALATPLLADGEAGVRALAVWIAADFCGSDDDERVAQVAPLVPRLRELAVADLDAEVRRQAARALQFVASHPAQRAAVEPALHQLLLDPDPALRTSVAFGLARLGSALDRAVAELGAALTRPEPPGSNEHQEICLMLAGLGPAAAPAVPGLLALVLTGPDADLMISIVDALAAAATPDALAQLRALDEPDSRVGRAAGAALRRARGT